MRADTFIRMNGSYGFYTHEIEDETICPRYYGRAADFKADSDLAIEHYLEAIGASLYYIKASDDWAGKRRS